MTIGLQLKEVQDQKMRERIARRSDMLRKFVKEDLLNALQDNINSGKSDKAVVIAPAEIRYLFAGRLSAYDRSPYEDVGSVYNKVWRELDDWAASENLSIFTGFDFGNLNDSSVPWSDKKWGGYLAIHIPKPVPVKPEPPQLRIETKGIKSKNVAIAFGIAVIILLLISIIGQN